jgi:para-aminobenzoate synthetase / 4-amino-4-deoxychorismate lyase
VRLAIGRSGAIAIEATPLPLTPAEPVEVRIVPLPVDPADFRLAHKTSDRAFYDDARRAAGTFEVLFARADGLLTEGSFTNLLVRKDGRLVTPPLARGLLPGIARAAMIEAGDVVEEDVRAEDLTGGFLLVNDLRGTLDARLV